jgi:hypothetical protein
VDQSQLLIQNNILAIKKVFNNLLTLKSSFNYKNNNELLEITPAVFTGTIGSNHENENSVQHLNKSIIDTQNSLSFSRKYGRFLFNPEVGVNLLSESLDSQINPEDPSHEISELSLLNDLNVTNFAPYINLKSEYNYKELIITFNLPFHNRNFQISNQLQNEETNFTRFNLEPELNIHYHINNFWKVNLSTEIKNEFGNANRIHNGFILKSYRYLRRFETPLEEIQSKMIGVNIDYRNPIKAFFWTFRYNYGLMTSNIQEDFSYSEGGASVINTLENEVNTTRQMASTNVSKYFHKIKTTLFSDATVMQVLTPKVLNAEVSDIENTNFNYNAGARGTLTSFLEYDYAFHQYFFSNQINNASSSFLRTNKHEISLDFLLTENQFCGIQFQSNNNFISGERTGFNNFMNLSYNYSFSKIGLDLRAEWRNVFDTQYYTTVFADANNYILSNFEMRPTQLLLKAQFSLSKFND